MAAILFKIEAFVRFGLTKTYTTDEVQKWNNVFTKSVKAAKSAKITFYGAEAKSRIRKDQIKS